MVSATCTVTLSLGTQIERVFNNVGNAAALYDQLKQAAQQVDGLLPVSTTDGLDVVLNVHTVADVQVIRYNGA